MTTAKKVIEDMRDTFYPLIKEMNAKENDPKLQLTYTEIVNLNTWVSWERALSFALAVMEDEENGTLDIKLAALTSKPKR